VAGPERLMLVEIPIGPNDAGQRAERFLRRYLVQVGMGRLQSLFRRREIKIGKRPAERGTLLRAGDLLRVFGLRPEECSGPQAAPPLTWAAAEPPPILFEDADLLVVDKPAGMAAHPGTGIPPGASLIERARAYLKKGGGTWDGELFAPSLIHRLDKETSGALLIAKTGSRLRGLSETLRAGRLRKRYLALVSGVPARSEGEIDVPLAREDSSAGAKARIGAGKRAMTRYRILKNTGSYSLLQVIIETGRMHQIRAHLAHLGHPVAGDTRYHRPSEARRQRRELGLDRIFLHAEALSWEEDGGVRSFRAPLPAELDAALRRLGLHAEPGA
jgi:23S rRNA pseudouridine955/2504/2580 synthase